jgi:hypothetical protein
MFDARSRFRQFRRSPWQDVEPPSAQEAAPEIAHDDSAPIEALLTEAEEVKALARFAVAKL